LDSMIRFHSGDENSNTEIAAFLDNCVAPLRAEFGCAFLILDHMRKPGKEDRNFDEGFRIRGAGTKRDSGDGAWTLTGDQSTDGRTLSCSKCRWQDRKPAPLQTRWRVSEDEQATWVECSDASLNAEVSVRAALGRQEAGMYHSRLVEACEAMGAAEKSVRRAVKRLVRDGTVERTEEP